MKEIKLTQGKVAFVDDADFEYFNQFRWCATKTKYGSFYAHRRSNSKGQIDYLYLHREIMNAKPYEYVDHKDGNGLNCQRANMRICTMWENQGNRVLNRNNSSGFKGVAWKKDREKWRARITKNEKSIHLGYFDHAETAALAYNLAAQKHFGEFAKLNELR
jgi:hypothetical protein